MANCMRNGNYAVQQRGVTYVAILLFIALSSAVLAMTAEVWSMQRQRSRERELLWIGVQFSRAIESYYQSSPGTVKRYPEKLEDLLEDRRHLAVRRYLRKLYRDPIIGDARWGVITAPQGGIMGVHSLSEDETVKRAGFGKRLEGLAGARRYSDWRFIYLPAD